MNQYREFLTRKQHQEIIQRINDLYSEDYLTGGEFTQLYQQLANELVHEDDDEIFTNNI